MNSIIISYQKRLCTIEGFSHRRRKHGAMGQEPPYIISIKHKDKEVERTVLQYYKYIQGLPGNATNIAVRGEVGQFPIHL